MTRKRSNLKEIKEVGAQLKDFGEIEGIGRLSLIKRLPKNKVKIVMYKGNPYALLETKTGNHIVLGKFNDTHFCSQFLMGKAKISVNENITDLERKNALKVKKRIPL